MSKKLKSFPVIFFAMLFICPEFEANAGPIRIGWSGPLTGDSAVLGIDGVEAARMAVDEVNEMGGIRGRRVELIVEDDQYSTRKAVSAYRKLVAHDHVVAMLMPTYGGAFSISKQALKDEVVVVNPLDCNDEIAGLSDNTFCVATLSESIGEAIAKHIKAGGHQSVGVIYDESNPFMVLVQKSLGRALGKNPSKFYRVDGVASDNSDFKNLLLRYKKTKVENLVLLGHDKMGLAMAQARGLGIDAQFYTVGTITSPGFQMAAGDSANGSLVAYWRAPETARLNAFRRRFAARKGRLPILELATIPSYDSMTLLLEAIEKSIEPDGSISKLRIRENLRAIRNYDGLSGNLDVDSDGAVRSIKEKMYRFDSGKLEALD